MQCTPGKCLRHLISIFGRLVWRHMIKMTAVMQCISHCTNRNPACAVWSPHSRATSMFTHNYWLISRRSESHTQAYGGQNFRTSFLPLQSQASNSLTASFPGLHSICCLQDVISHNWDQGSKGLTQFSCLTVWSHRIWVSFTMEINIIIA